MDNSLCSETSSTCDDKLWIEHIVQQLAARGLASAFILFFEMHRPLRGLFQASALIAEPMYRALLGAEKAGRLTRLLQNPKSAELFLQCLEQHAKSRTAHKHANR